MISVHLRPIILPNFHSENFEGIDMTGFRTNQSPREPTKTFREIKIEVYFLRLTNHGFLGRIV